MRTICNFLGGDAVCVTSPTLAALIVIRGVEPRGESVRAVTNALFRESRVSGAVARIDLPHVASRSRD